MRVEFRGKRVRGSVVEFGVYALPVRFYQGGARICNCSEDRGLTCVMFGGRMRCCLALRFLSRSVCRCAGAVAMGDVVSC